MGLRNRIAQWLRVLLARISEPVPLTTIPSELRLETDDGPIAWRVYPSGSTTVEELLRACKALQLEPWLDDDWRICLVLGDLYRDPPSAMEVAVAMYGVDTLTEWAPEERALWMPQEAGQAGVPYLFEGHDLEQKKAE